MMRASGSYRVLLNTCLWADMKCDRANQKSIRMAAQDGDKISVFLITVGKSVRGSGCCILSCCILRGSLEEGTCPRCACVMEVMW